MKGILLTKSSKDNGYCITVMRTDNGQIMRLVSDSQGYSLPKTIFENIHNLDIIEFDDTLLISVPQGPQTENYLTFLPSIKAVGKYSGSFEEIYNHYCTTLTGQKLYTLENNDRLMSADNYSHSLEIIKVNNFRIYMNPQHKLKAAYTYNNYDFKNISFTDYDSLAKYFEMLNIGEAYLIITIPSKPYIVKNINHGYYKFIAAYYPIHKS